MRKMKTKQIRNTKWYTLNQESITCYRGGISFKLVLYEQNTPNNSPHYLYDILFDDQVIGQVRRKKNTPQKTLEDTALKILATKRYILPTENGYRNGH